MRVFELVAGGPDPDEVMQETWGHLNARPNVRHAGVIVFAHSAYDGLVVLSVDFGDDAGDGPWFYEHLHKWLAEQDDAEPGTCYRFTGWYRHNGYDHDDPGDESYEFVGDTTVVSLTG